MMSIRRLVEKKKQ